MCTVYGRKSYRSTKVQMAACACNTSDLDIFPCGGDGGINLDDLLAALDAFARQQVCVDGCE